MDEGLLSTPEIAELKAAHRHAKTRREADRIKVVVLLSKGWTAVAAVAEALLLDEDTDVPAPIRAESGVFGGAGFSRRRAMPRTICLMPKVGFRMIRSNPDALAFTLAR